MKKIFLILSVILYCDSIIGQPINTNISNALLFNGEPYLAINPTNNQNIVVAWMSMTFANGQFTIGIKTKMSMNGGNNWSSAFTQPHFGAGFGSADVSIAFDKNGTAFLSYIDYKQNPDSGGIYITRSFDGGNNWDAPNKVFDMYDVPNKRPIDRPWLVIDNSATTNKGTLYITTKPAPWISAPNRNYFKSSNDSGKTWSGIANVDGNNFMIGNLITAPMAAPANTINGKFCAVYPSFVATQNALPTFYFASSFNKGQSFNYTTIFASTVAPVDGNLKAAYRLMANPADSNQLICFFVNGANGDADIMASNSTNGGQTWSTLKRVNDDAIANGKDQDMVWASYNQQGNLVVTWRDRRSATSNGFWNAGYDFYYATSIDNGQTFSANQKLSSQFISFDSAIAASGNDMMNCAYNNDTLNTTWGDTRNGKMNIYFTKTIASTNTNVGISVLEGNDLQFTIYPNPSKNYIQLVANNKFIDKEIIISDANGKKIISTIFKTTSSKIDISTLKSGNYLLMLDGNIERFIKQ